MTLGAGFFPAGYGYAGLVDVPATVENPGPARGVAFIDQNGDYQVDGTGDLVKTTSTRQRVMLLLRTELTSVATDQSLGLKPERAIDLSWNYRMTRSVERALLPMTADGTIRIEKIDVTRPLHFRASIAVTYTVLASGEEEIASVNGPIV